MRILTGRDMPNPADEYERSRPKWYIGLDLGQSQDYTALAVMRALLGADGRRAYQVGHLERFRLGTSYVDIVAKVKGLLARPELGDCWELIVDRGGVGRGVVDLIRSELAGEARRIKAVTITGGDTDSADPMGYRVPKRDLVHSLKVLLEGGRIQFAGDLADVPVLIHEAMAFQWKITTAGNDTYNAREGQHDDLLLAVCLATWYAERHGARAWKGRSCQG